MNRSSTALEEIKSKLDIVDFVGSYVTLKKSGKYFKANCPFHQEKTASFVVSPEIQRWQCFGACHEGGDAISFLMKWENITFGEALKILSERTGVPLGHSAQSGFSDADTEIRNRLYALLDTAAKFYAFVLTQHAAAHEARAYLAQRGLNDKIIQTFGLGFAPIGWTSFVDYAHKKGFTDTELIQGGLAVETSRGSTVDRFRGRIMFPLKNTLNKVLGFSGRLLTSEITEKTGAKYVNTPETKIYHKRENLYGFFISKDAIKKENTAIVVEGEFDFLTPFAKGIENIVAIKGSAFTSDQLRVLRRYCERLVITLDNDEAGHDALKRSVIEAQAFGFDVYVGEIPGGKDPDDAARSDFPALAHALKKPTPVFDYLIKLFSEHLVLGDPYAKKHFVESMAPYLDLIDNPVVKTHYIQHIATLISTSQEAIREMLNTIKSKSNPRVPRAQVSAEQGAAATAAPEDKHERELLRQLLTLTLAETKARIATLLTGDEFTTLPTRELFVSWKKSQADARTLSPQRLISEMPEAIRPFAEELYLSAGALPEGAKEDEYHRAKETLRMALQLKKRFALSRIQQVRSDESDASDAVMREMHTILQSVEKELSLL